MLEPIIGWAERHSGVLSTLGGVSLLMLLVTPLLVPWWVGTLPEDYFVRPPTPLAGTARLRAWAATLVGGLLVAAGVAMLVLPGQGLLTMFVGLSLMHFPGKRALQRRMLQGKGVARALQWMRRRSGKPPMRLPDAAHHKAHEANARERRP